MNLRNFAASIVGLALFAACLNIGIAKDSNEANFHSAFAEVNGIRLHYLEKGEGSVILFLHGFPFSSDTWIPVMQPLSDSFKTVAIDGRGYARSDKPEAIEDYHIKYLVADVEEFIRSQFPEQKVVLVGHDWGGTVAWTVAQHNPELIEKLVVINAPPFNLFLQMLAENESQQQASRYVPRLKSKEYEDQLKAKGAESVWEFAYKRLFDKGLLSESFKQQFLSSWGEPGTITGAINWYRANIPDFAEIDEADYWPAKNSRVTVPAMLLWGENEVIFVPDTFNKIPEVVDDLEVKVIKNAGHSAHLEQTAEVVHYIRDFIKQDGSLYE